MCSLIYRKTVVWARKGKIGNNGFIGGGIGVLWFILYRVGLIIIVERVS